MYASVWTTKVEIESKLCNILYNHKSLKSERNEQKTRSNLMVFVAVGEYSYVLLLWRALARVTRSRIDDDQIR